MHKVVGIGRRGLLLSSCIGDEVGLFLLFKSGIQLLLTYAYYETLIFQQL